MHYKLKENMKIYYPQAFETTIDVPLEERWAQLQEKYKRAQHNQRIYRRELRQFKKRQKPPLL